MRISDWSSDVCSSDLLIAVREFAAGERVGYGGHFVCPERMPVGVVAVGYADGIHRAFANGTPLIVAGQRVSLAGRVSMDMITVDLRRAPQAAVGDPVRLWGPGLASEEIDTYSGPLEYGVFLGPTHGGHCYGKTSSRESRVQE